MSNLEGFNMTINADELKVKKTSAEWYEEIKHNTIIIDPDGWDRQNYDFSFNKELITEDEFNQRLLKSTIQYKFIIPPQPPLQMDIDLTITKDGF